MDVLFKNSHTNDKETAKEVYRYFYYQRKLYIVSYIMLAVFFIQNLIYAILGFNYSIALFIIIPIGALFPTYCYFYQFNAMLKRTIETYGKEITTEKTVTEEFIHNVTETGNQTKIPLCNIKVAIQTKNLIMLRSQANLLYIFRKDSFTVGTKEDFITFLKSKGICVKGK